jgi:4-amino-4-deoxy-L-arabinose transferase-like glycosyltransferase
VAARYARRVSDARTTVRDLSLLTVLVVAVLAWPLAAPPIGTHGEAREGLVVEHIVDHGRWILPLRNGELPSKPPLFHWIAAGASHVVGLADATVRVPSALAAWLVLALVYLVGTAAGGRASGWFAVGALAGMHTFFESATEARVDMVFTACVTLALVAFLRWDHYGREAARTDPGWARALCYAAVAAAVLTKGPAGAVLPGLVIVAFLARDGRLGRLGELWSPRLALGAAAVVLAWYALATWLGGWDFLARQIFHENVNRFVGRGVFGMHGGRSRLTMVENLATDLLPWNLVLVWAAVRWWRGEREDGVGRFLHTWWIVILLFFTAAYGKRGVYLLPLHPAIALLAGRALARLWAAVPPRRARTLVVGVATVTFAVALVGQIVRVHRAGRQSLVPFGAEVGAIVPRAEALVADASLDESDLLVLAYRLDRDVPRVAAGACVAGAYRLASARDGGGDSGAVLVRSERRGIPVVLTRDPPSCPLAPESGNDR